MVQLSYMKLRIQRDICPNILLVKKLSRFIMQIFRKIMLNIGDFKRFEYFSNLTKHQIFKLLSRASGSTQLHESQDSERYISKYFTGQKKLPFFTFWKFTKLYSTSTFHMSYKIAPIPWLVVILISWVLTSVMIWLYML